MALSPLHLNQQPEITGLVVPVNEEDFTGDAVPTGAEDRKRAPSAVAAAVARAQHLPVAAATSPSGLPPRKEAHKVCVLPSLAENWH